MIVKIPIIQEKIKIVILKNQELKDFLKKENMVSFDGRWEPNKNTLTLGKTDINTITHESWHILESFLFIRRDWNINLEGHNEHIAYFLGFLVEKIYKKVNETESQ